MNKPPAFQFYAKEWLASRRVALMTPEQRGAYIQLLAYQWDSGISALPNDAAVLSKLSGMDDRWNEHGKEVRACFDRHPGRRGHIHNRKLSGLWAQTLMYLASQKSKAIKRWHGNDLRVCRGNAAAMPKQCPASASASASASATATSTTTTSKDTKIAPKAHALRASYEVWKKDPNFLTFVNSYPKRMRFGIDRAWEQWKMLMPDGSMRSVITDALSRWIRSDQWRREDGQAIPRMDNFLRGRYWEADPLARPRDTGVVVHVASSSNGKGTK